MSTARTPIIAEELEDYLLSSPLGESIRLFYEAQALPELELTKSRALSLPGVVIVDSTWAGGRGLSSAWTLTFTYHGYRFFIDTNNHSVDSFFFVSDPECPTDILVKVLQHFHEWSRLRQDFAAPPVVESPSVVNRFIDWATLGLSVVFALSAVVWAIQREFAMAIGLLAISALLFVSREAGSRNPKIESGKVP